MVTRDQIISEARKWIGTPFHKQESKLGVGCDCICLIIGVSNNLGLKSIIGHQIKNYVPKAYDYFKDKEHFFTEMHKHFIQRNKAKAAVAVVGNKYIGWHTGIIANYKENCCTWIHSCMSQKKVIEQRFIENIFDSAHYFDWYNN